MPAWVWMLASLPVLLAVCLFSLLDRIYRDLGRMTSSYLRERLEIFERQVEPHLHMDRKTAALLANVSADVWLGVLFLLTFFAVARPQERLSWVAMQAVALLGIEIVLGRQIIPAVLLLHTPLQWLSRLALLLRLWFWVVRPLGSIVSVSTLMVELSEEVSEPTQANGERIEALVEAAQEEGLLQGEEAQLIEQVVEFGDKRVRDVMTPRPDVVAISADASIAELRRVLVEKRFSRLPVYEGTLDEIVGIVHARDVLQVSEPEAERRKVRDLMRPALLVPETKLGSELLREMRQKQQQMAIAIDEYGQLAGVVTLEDLVEEIVGEIDDEDRRPIPDVVPEGPDSVLLRGSVAVEKLPELLGVEIDRERIGPATTIAGLLNHLTGHVPVSGEVVDYDGLRFEVLEANQRKVLRLRARRLVSPLAKPAGESG